MKFQITTSFTIINEMQLAELENYRKEYNTRDITTEEFKSLLKTSN